MRLPLVLAGLLALMPFRAQAFDIQGKWDTIGIGTTPCSGWSHYRKDDPKSSSAIFYLSWVEGFVSAINEFVPTKSTSIAKDLPQRGIGEWFDYYCSGHPDDTMDAAAGVFITSRMITELRKP